MDPSTSRDEQADGGEEDAELDPAAAADEARAVAEHRRALAEWRAEIRPISRRTGYPTHAYAHLFWALDQLQDGPEGRRPRQVSARELCQSLCELVVDRHGARAPAIMRRLRLRRSEDVGRIVFSLVEVGWMSAREGESEEDFRGLPAVAALASRSEEPWLWVTCPGCGNTARYAASERGYMRKCRRCWEVVDVPEW